MQNDIKDILKKVSIGEISPEDAFLKIKTESFKDLGYAKVDLNRKLRKGVTEVIYGEGKTPEQIIGIASALKESGQGNIIITRVSPEKADVISKKFDIEYNAPGRIVTIGEKEEPKGAGTILVATGGTSDIPVAEEAFVTAEFLGNSVKKLYDAGVAGIHRLLNSIDDIMSASVIIAVAGMEGALPSVIGGLCDRPVIAVPSSVGYGASFGGLTALLSMLNSCSSGVSVVNIDNGFGAGYLASMINHTGF